MGLRVIRVIREGFPGIASMHKERETERIHTRKENYLWHYKGEKKIFSRSWYLYYSNLVFGHMEYPLPLKY